MTQDVKWAGQVDADDSDMFCDDCGLPWSMHTYEEYPDVDGWVGVPVCPEEEDEREN